MSASNQPEFRERSLDFLMSAFQRFSVWGEAEGGCQAGVFCGHDDDPSLKPAQNQKPRAADFARQGPPRTAIHAAVNGLFPKNLIRQQKNMNPNPIHALLALILLPIGGILIFGSKLGVALASGQDATLTAVFLFSLLGAIFWIWGCFHLAIASKLNPAFGMLGLFFLVGFFVILWCAKKQPEWERAAARHRATNPNKEYRGDPDSLY